jgi:hypothetical protein
MIRLAIGFLMILWIPLCTQVWAQTATPTASSADSATIQKMKEKIELEKLQLEEAELKVKLLKAQEQLSPQPTPIQAKVTNSSSEDLKGTIQKLKSDESKKAHDLALADKDKADLFVLDFLNEEIWYKGVRYSVFELQNIAHDQNWKVSKTVSGRTPWGEPRYLYQYLNISVLKYDRDDRGILVLKAPEKPGDFQFLTPESISFVSISGDVRTATDNDYYKYEGQDQKDNKKFIKYGHDGGIGFNDEIEFYFDQQDKLNMIRYGILGQH